MENTPILFIKKLHAAAVVPAYATSGSACFDLVSIEGGVVEPGASAVFRTGLAVEMTRDWVMKVYSRSGHGFNHSVRLVNAVGIIDSDYRGEIVVGLRNDGLKPFPINPGDRVAQAMLEPVQQVEFRVVDELSDTARGTGGFGSTGK